MKTLFLWALMFSATTANAGEIVASSAIKDVLMGNSIGWGVDGHSDGRTLTIKKGLRPYSTASNIVLRTTDGLEAFDIAKDGRVSRNDDRRILRNGGQLEFAPARVLVLDMPGKVKSVEWTRPLALQIQVVVDGHYVAIKYAPYSRLSIKGPRRLTVTTDSGRFSFDVVSGNDGAPIYHVIGAD